MTFDNRKIEAQFDQAMLDLYDRAGREIGYWANRMLQQIRAKGGLKTAKSLLIPTARDLRPGLKKLVKGNRLDLSVEYLVLQEPYRQLFTKQELHTAEAVLAFLDRFGPDLVRYE